MELTCCDPFVGIWLWHCPIPSVDLSRISNTSQPWSLTSANNKHSTEIATIFFFPQEKKTNKFSAGQKMSKNVKKCCIKVLFETLNIPFSWRKSIKDFPGGILLSWVAALLWNSQIFQALSLS